MIKKQTIIDLIEEHFTGSDNFLVEVKITPSNKIEIYIDSPNHITIAECVALSRHIEGNLDREKEDFELQVSSPGATESFKVLQQYKKYTGTKVSIKTTEGMLHEGILLSVNETECILEETRKEKKPIGKGNHTVIEQITFNYKQIKETKSVLPF